ncbi:hypothetical protein EV201_3107 [Ancylomarina subtilis]|uniref:Uncharacterized protein n=1 Tax=Ancylomarina subtilis TaxID=1639035 RepID=A0A4Q7V7K7_9BACT|nr:hypothetical protein [Ancylomarina subtilis]RZT91293.1 hypothetical protein EV201_3107 [Ancylomarina subtilis]
MAKDGTNRLQSMAQFSLFATSYLPLFVLLIAKQFNSNYKYFHFGGVNSEAFEIFLTKFGLSVILTLISIIGYVGFLFTVSNLDRDVENGFSVKVKDIRNKNSEAISYIATYIIPFVFLELNNWFELFSILFLILIIYRIYINSSLVLINPVLSIKYSLYEVDYEESNATRTGFIISRDKYLQEDERIKIYEIGHKMYYSKTINND